MRRRHATRRRLNRATNPARRWGSALGSARDPRRERSAAPAETRHRIHTRTCCENAAYTSYPLIETGMRFSEFVKFESM